MVCKSLDIAPAPLATGSSAKMASEVRKRVRNVSSDRTSRAKSASSCKSPTPSPGGPSRGSVPYAPGAYPRGGGDGSRACPAPGLLPNPRACVPDRLSEKSGQVECDACTIPCGVQKVPAVPCKAERRVSHERLWTSCRNFSDNLSLPHEGARQHSDVEETPEQSDGVAHGIATQSPLSNLVQGLFAFVAEVGNAS
jgi:hypothetical protein